jgi:hypothetical protein
MVQTCPNCQSKDIGKLTKKNYFCWNCCVELEASPERVNVFQIEKDGSVSSLNDLFYEDVVFVDPQMARTS